MNPDTKLIPEEGMYHVFNQNGVWLETRRYVANQPVFGNFYYVKVHKAAYPTPPIEDGVYRCKNNKTETHFLERKNNSWWHGCGQKSTLDWEIIEKMT